MFHHPIVLSPKDRQSYKTELYVKIWLLDFWLVTSLYQDKILPENCDAFKNWFFESQTCELPGVDPSIKTLVKYKCQ